MTYEEMKRKLVLASNSYYNKSISIMSDEEFDKLKDEFIEQYPNDPFIQTIGSPVPESSQWNKVKHDIPMNSLNKVVDLKSLEKWLSNIVEKI